MHVPDPDCVVPSTVCQKMTGFIVTYTIDLEQMPLKRMNRHYMIRLPKGRGAAQNNNYERITIQYNSQYF